MKTIKGIIGKALIWIDVKINDWILFGKKETISARMGRSLASENPNPLATIICGFLDIADRHHCKKAYESLLEKQAAELAAKAKKDAKASVAVDKAISDIEDKK